MSRFKKFLKPRTNRLIAGLAIVGLIILGSYLAYKNNIFADTPASGCNNTARIVQNFPGAHPIYLLDQANYNQITQNPSSINAIQSFSNGQTTRITNSGNLYFVVHTEATTGSRIAVDTQALTCSQNKIGRAHV